MLLHANPDLGGGTQAAGLEQVVTRFKQAKKVGRDKWMAFCQSHDDGEKSGKRSLSLRIVRDGEPKILAKCLAGCATEAAVAAAGLTMADLFEHFERKAPRSSARRTLVATYNYRDPAGELKYQTLRYEPKDFSLRRPDGHDAWIWNLKGVEPLLYRLDQLMKSKSRIICLTEGERDADTLAALDLASTTNHGGSGCWTDAHTSQLAALKPELVVIFEDNDEAGRKRTTKVAPSLMAVGLEVKVITGAELVGLPEKGDISDWLAAGHTRDELLAVIEKTGRHTKIEQQQAVLESDVEPVEVSEPAEEPLEVLRGRAQEILDLEDPLVAVEAAIRAQGYGGSANPPLIVYIATTSRLLKQGLGSAPCHLLIIATSGGGKTYTQRIITSFLPENALHELKAGSARALIYDKGDLQHRTLVFAEADSLPSDEDNPAASAIRALLQDNELSYDVVVKDPKGKGFITQKIRRPGPTQFITTSTRRFRDHQMATRVFELEIPTDAQKVRASLRVQAYLTNHPALAPDQVLIHFQAYLQRRAPWDVYIPFADALADLIGRQQHEPRILRDFTKLLALIKAVAIIRHAHRETDEQGRVVATLEDYATVRALVGDMYEKAVSGATEGVRQVAEAVRGGAKSIATVGQYLTVINGERPMRRSVYRWVETAISSEWIRNEESNAKKPKILAAGEPVPERVQLPTLEALSAWGVSCVTPLPEPKAESNVDTGVHEGGSSPSGRVMTHDTVSDSGNGSGGLEECRDLCQKEGPWHMTHPSAPTNGSVPSPGKPRDTDRDTPTLDPDDAANDLEPDPDEVTF